MIESLISDILFGFAGLISIINPFGIAFVFVERTASFSDEERRLLAKKIAINAFFVLLVAFFVGTPVLHFFGISIEALRIGGGLSVAVAGWKMLNEPDHAPARAAKPPFASPAAGDAGLAGAAASAGSMAPPTDAAAANAFFPWTVPLTTGPGSIATAIALNANRTHKLSAFLISGVASVAISVLVMAVIYVVYSRAGRLAAYLGPNGTHVAMRVSSFLLLCIGVQIMLTGLEGFLAPIASLPHAAG
ncbi:antibiotic resistance protein [Burkholderia sp. WAC0059]|uniref:MarC family protein n=1 Tax=Burkholderia sp. WAC0059 TaxID=2066022 RepID=UPI000C7EBC5E|nr:MarC family protein [Burkholderia sp. WAC0059]PLZ03846.1 antibiotic resistance protein [Burkholderia sp. WAC0059]